MVTKGDIKCNQAKNVIDSDNEELLHLEDDEKFYHPPSLTNSDSKLVSEIPKPREIVTDSYLSDMTYDNAIDEPAQNPPPDDTNDDSEPTEESQDRDRLQTAKQNALTIKDAGVLSRYLQGEATVARAAPRCEECSRSCFDCIKTGRMSTSDEVTLQRMEGNLKENKLQNGST